MSAQLYRFRDFTDGDLPLIQFIKELHALLDAERFAKLSVSQIVGALDIIKMELVMRMHEES